MKSLLSRLSFCLFLSFGQAFALTPQEQKADRPADLGSETIDVSSYPTEQQENYKIFQEKCSRCHSPARALFSKYTTEEEWHHFVSMMHGRLISRNMKPSWKPQEGRSIIDFLAYDSKVRKVDNKLGFEEQLRQLNKRFAEVQREKQKKAKNQATQPSAPFTGANP